MSCVENVGPLKGETTFGSLSNLIQKMYVSSTKNKNGKNMGKQDSGGGDLGNWGYQGFLGGEKRPLKYRLKEPKGQLLLPRSAFCRSSFLRPPLVCFVA